MSGADRGELVFVVDVTSFTKKGFIGTTNYEGQRVDLEFDEDGDGLFLDPGMARKVGVKKGAPVSVVVEDDVTTVAKTRVAGVGRTLRISDAKVYYAIGREGGAVLKVRRT